jgi:hypothetical protein
MFGSRIGADTPLVLTARKCIVGGKAWPRRQPAAEDAHRNRTAYFYHTMHIINFIRVTAICTYSSMVFAS